jgi:hypothetical protein
MTSSFVAAEKRGVFNGFPSTNRRALDGNLQFMFLEFF